MVKVCEDMFPMGSYPGQRTPGFYMHEYLKMQLDYYIKNVIDDWDFTIIICGEGEVRVGKSVLGQQICAYWADQMYKVHGIKVPWNIAQNLVFKGRDLIKKGNYLGINYKYAPLDYDEAGGDLDSTKVMHGTTQAVKAFLRECGQYNMLNVLILPEFFELPRGIALSRTRCLISVYYMADEEGYFKRGYFKYFSRPAKKRLYIDGKKYLDYNAAKPDFQGDFDNTYTLPEKEYREEKIKALKEREKVTLKEVRYKSYTRAAFKWMHTHGMSHREIADWVTKNGDDGIKLGHVWVGKILGKEYTDDEEEEAGDI